MNPLLAPLALPPKLVARALDDLHAIAVAARDLGGHLQHLERRADEVLEGLALAVEVARAIEHRGAQAIDMLERVEGRAEALLALGVSIEHRAEALLTFGERLDGRADAIDGLAHELLREGKMIQDRAREVAEAGTEVAAGLPALRRAVEMAEPLEGAVERLGRIVDRLPGRRPGSDK